MLINRALVDHWSGSRIRIKAGGNICGALGLLTGEMRANDGVSIRGGIELDPIGERAALSTFGSPERGRSGDKIGAGVGGFGLGPFPIHLGPQMRDLRMAAGLLRRCYGLGSDWLISADVFNGFVCWHGETSLVWFPIGALRFAQRFDPTWSGVCFLMQSKSRILGNRCFMHALARGYVPFFCFALGDDSFNQNFESFATCIIKRCQIFVTDLTEVDLSILVCQRDHAGDFPVREFGVRPAPAATAIG
jgi:hypothetical protein